MAPATQKALLLKERHGHFVTASISVPKPGRGEVLVKVLAASLNPFDWKVQKYGVWIEDYPAILGNDLSGVIEEVGPEVDGWKAGDVVFTQAQILPPKFAAFQEYAIALIATLAKVPRNISLEEAASLPLTLSTAYVGLYQAVPDGLGFTPPTCPETQGIYHGTPIFVVGGGSCVGQNVVQLARISGFHPILSSAPPSHFEHLKSLGVTHVFDSKLAAMELKPLIEAVCHLPLQHVFDAISTPDTQETAHDILADYGQMAVVSPVAVSPANGKVVRRVYGFLRSCRNRALLETLYHDNISGWLEKGMLKPNVVEVLHGGLQAIPEGLERLHADEISAKKLVIHPQEAFI